MAHGAHVLRGVAGHGHQVGQQAGADAAAVGEVKNLGVATGGLAQHLQRRQAEVAHQLFHLAGVVAVGKYARVAAHGQAHAGFEGRLHAHMLLLNAGWLGFLPLLPALILRNGIARGHGGAQGHAALLHQLEYLGVSVVAVLNGFDPGQRGAPHAFHRGGVRHHAPARRARRLHDERQFFQ